MRYYLIFFVSLFVCEESLAQFDFDLHWQDNGSTYRDHSLDISHMKVNVEFEPSKGKVIGAVQHTFQPIRKTVDSVFWDAIDICVSEVLLDGKRIEHKMVPGGITTYFNPPLQWEKTHTVSFKYTAFPQRGIYFIGWNVDSITDPRNQTRKQIWTQGQGIDNRHWIPMYDNMNDKFTTETITTMDSKYKVLSNGQLVKKNKQKNGSTVWHYKLNKPHAGYLLMLGIGDYAVQKTETKSGTPVQFWYYPEHPEKLKWSSMYTEQIIEFLEAETGTPFPWDTYSQIMVQDFIYGAMENTSATIFGDFFNVDSYSFNDRNYIGVNAHELTHQWFGDLITARTSSDIWLQESFATYYAKLFELHLHGPNEFKWNQYMEMQHALNASEKDNLPVRHSNAGSARVYQKGSVVIQMLRKHVGDEAFKKVIKFYLKEHAHGNVETNDFMQAFEDVLGIQIQPFFDQWIWRGDEPNFQVTSKVLNNFHFLEIEQVQPISPLRPAFRVNLDLEVHYTDGSSEIIPVAIEKAIETVLIPTKSKSVSFIVFDSNNEVLKELDYHQPTSAWLAQSTQAAYAVDRFLALKQVRHIDISLKRPTLQKIAANEKEFVQVRAEAIRQLANDSESEKAVLQVVENSDVPLRRAYLSSTDSVTMTQLPFFMSALNDHSYQNILTAVKKITRSSYINEQDKLAALDKVKTIRGQNQNVRIAYLQENFLIEEKGLAELTSYLSDRYEFRTRLQTMRAIEEIGAFNPLIVRHILKAGVSNNRRLGNPAVSLLNDMSKSRNQAQVISQVLKEMDLTDKEKSKLSSLLRQLP